MGSVIFTRWDNYILILYPYLSLKTDVENQELQKRFIYNMFSILDFRVANV